MKKGIAFVLTVVLLATLATGCASSMTVAEPTIEPVLSATAEPTVQQDAAQEEAVSIVDAKVNENGELIPTEKIRGRKQSLDCIVNRMAETIINPEEQTVYIMHGDAMADAEYVADLIKKQIPNVKDIKIQFVGPIIGSHTGDGIMCVIYMGKERSI